MKLHLDQALPPTQVACRRLRTVLPAFRLPGCQQWETILKEMPSHLSSQLCAPGKGWDPLPEHHYSHSALLNSICLGCYWKNVLTTENQMDLYFLMYRVQESKTDQRFEYHWDANEATDVWFKRHISIFLNFQREILIMTGLASHAFPQDPSLLTDSMNV